MKLLKTLQSLAVAACVAGTFLPLSAAAKDDVVIDLVNEPSSLDPHMQWNPDSYFVYRNIFDNLVTRDDEGKIAPQVATSWRQLSDSEIEFQLRTDIVFHNGAKLTADDVVYSVKRITDPKLGSPQLGQYDKIKNAVATGPASVKLVTDGPYPALLAQLVKLSIVPASVVEAVGKDAFNMAPVGSGPYKFVEWRRGVSVALARNDGYWGMKGPFKTAVFRAVPDAATRLANVQTGASQIVRALDSDLSGQLANSRNAKRVYTLTERLSYLRINPTKPPFNNAKLRQAAAYAIDKAGITEGILGNLDKPLAQMVTPAHLGWSDKIKGISFDLDKAKALLKEAGVPPKFDFLVGTFFDQRVAQAIQQQLRTAGFDVNIVLVDTLSFLKQIQAGAPNGPTLALVTSSCACQDADGALYSLFRSGGSWSIIDNKEIDSLLDNARAGLDEKRRLADYEKVGEFIANDVPTVPLYQMVAIFGVAKQLNWRPTPNESFFLNRMSWSE